MLLEFRQRLDTLCDDQAETVVTVLRLYSELCKHLIEPYREFECSDGFIESGVCKVVPEAFKHQKIVVFRDLREAVQFSKRSCESLLFFDGAKDHDEYRAMHSCCPVCGNVEIESTCVGWLPGNWKTAKDTNDAYCKCGWRGEVHDLKP